MNTRDQRICLWLVPVFGAVLLVAYSIFPGSFPPMSPTMSANQVAAFYRDNLARIRTSMIILNCCEVMFIPFYMVVVVQMQRMANPSRAFSYSYLSAAASGATMFALADIAWLAAAFRPERDPQLTLLLNDFAWMAFIAPIGFIVAQNFCLALGIYLDERSKPIFPRWAAHFNILMAVLMAPGAFAVMFKTGPFAWNGFMAYWVRMSAFALYIVVMFFVVRSAIEQQDLDERAAT
jgi:hypothetical protein